MTKNVEQYSSTWLKMKSALASLTGGSGSYSTSSYGGPSSGASHAGFKRDIDQLVSISESAKKLIQERDSDGVVSFHYHDERQTAQSLQGKLESLEKYAGNVSTYLKNRIDQPFYKAIDGVGAKLEALSIASYKTSNTIGYQRTDVVKDVYGNPMGTQKVTPKEIGLEELYRVDNPYKKTLQASYQDFKNSKTYKDHQLTETEFLMASHHTRAFNYESIRDQQEAIEMWRDIALGVGVVVLTIFCPPAGAVAGVVLAGAEMYSAATGKDWGTGRELSDGERILRGSFALFDLIPGAKYLHTVAKSGSVVAAKGLLKTSLKEGFEQGARNFDNGLKLLTKFGDNVLKQVDNFGRQGDQLLNKLLSSGADQLSAGLKTIDGTISQAAQNFRLNMGLEPQLVSGVMPSPGSSSINKISNKLDDFSKARKLRVSNLDEVGEGAKKFFKAEPVELPSGEIAYKSADMVDGEAVLVRSPEFLDESGHIKWPDANGFVLDSAGNPITEPANLKAGQFIDRYGNPYGRFTSPLENGQKLPYETRGLPYPEGYQPYHKYEVVKDINIENVKLGFSTLSSNDRQLLSAEMERYGKNLDDLANPKVGEIAKVFGQGGGTQIQFEISVKWYEKMGLLKEVD